MLQRLVFFTLLLAVFLTAGTSFAAASRQIRIDLAAIDSGSERTLETSPGEYTVTIVNRLPQGAYDVQVAVSFISLEPLPVPGSRGQEEITPPCPELTAATTELLDSATEAEMPARVRAVKDLVASCSETIPLRLAEKALARTRIDLPDVYRLESGQELKVTISRRDGMNQKQWTVVYRTPARGRWFSSYGFVFVRNEDELFFAKPKTGATGQYVITQKADKQDYDFAPSIFYAWLPARREGRDLSLGVAAGLGFDQNNPIVFAGPMLTYNQNISLVAGVVMHKEKRLNGMYSLGQEVTENLSEAQLGEETYRPSLFFGLSFRFGANPFAASSDAGTSATTTTTP